MGESFVDVSYRGLEVGKRLKLRDVRSETGYVELPLPMPVGTRVEIVADGGLRIEALVTSVHEQIGGSDVHPGMRVKPLLNGAAATWWQEHVDAAAEAAEKAAAHVAAQARAEAEAAAAEVAAAAATAAAPPSKATTVMSTDAVQQALAAAEDGEQLADDGKRTDVMSVVDLSQLEGTPGGATTVMDAIDISMITGEPTSDVGATGTDDDDVEISVETGGEISGDLEMTPSGRVTNGNGKSKAGTKKGRTRKGKR